MLYYPTQQAALLSKLHTLVLSHTICTYQVHHFIFNWRKSRDKYNTRSIVFLHALSLYLTLVMTR